MKNKTMIGRILLIFTIIVWGATFVVTKKLLVSFSPTEILVYRYSLSFVILFLIYPKILKWQGFKVELLCVGAALSGITIYQFLENSALQYTYAANVSIIIACAAFFTAMFSQIILKTKSITVYFVIGFIISILGITFMSLNGIKTLKLNPLGDIMALIASILWGIYSVLITIVGKTVKNTLQLTRRVTMYGVIFLIPLYFITNSKVDFTLFSDINNLLLMLYLGLIASALCFVTWNQTIKYLGTVKTSLGVYAIPVVTVVVGWIFLDEKMTIISGVGILITIIGLYISSIHQLKHKKRENE